MTEIHRKEPRMRRLAGSALLLLLSLAGPAAAQDTLFVAASAGGDSLRNLLAEVPDHTVVRLGPGVFDLQPRPYVEPTCGNCKDPETRVEATVGLSVFGEAIRILGASEGESILRTRSGYGVLFEDCLDCSLEDVVVTAGKRDRMAAATDAGVVVKRSRVRIRGCSIRHNVGDSVIVADTVVGIAGIVGREGAEIWIEDNHILGNSWDGIVLYRDAVAVIENNVIDGVELARGERVGGGRGVGIGVTGQARAGIYGNLVRRYWKGIGVFLDARVHARSNIVEHLATWGMTLWDAETGSPLGDFTGNVIFDTGACGAALICPNAARGSRFGNNVLARTGQDPRYDSGVPYCIQVPIARHDAPDHLTVQGNLFLDNRVPEGNTAPAQIQRDALIGPFAPIFRDLRAFSAVQLADFWKMLGG